MSKYSYYKQLCLSAGCWYSPTVTGSTPLPCHGFSFTKISEERVVMFGGYTPLSYPRCVKDIYTLVLSTLVSHPPSLLLFLSPSFPPSLCWLLVERCICTVLHQFCPYIFCLLQYMILQCISNNGKQLCAAVVTCTNK